MVVKRITMFKFKEEDVAGVLEQYEVLKKEAKKDGKPYIISMAAHKLHDDPRSGGLALAAESEFESLEDMAYYDNDCDAHKALKAYAGPKALGPPTTVHWDA